MCPAKQFRGVQLSEENNNLCRQGLSAEERRNNFKEVEIGFDEAQAIVEAKRCLQCPDPKCVEGCPGHVKIPEFIKQIREKKYAQSAEIIKESHFFPSICGRVCPQEHSCEGACILNKTGKAIQIGMLERFIGDRDKKKPTKENTSKKKVAVIGSGPAGLTVAQILAMNGVKVKIFDAFSEPGGVLRYGIPEFRLTNKVLDRQIKKLSHLDIEFVNNIIVGVETTIANLSKEFDAVFVGTGAGRPNTLNIPGEHLSDVFPALEFLIRLHMKKLTADERWCLPFGFGKKILVIGGGNVAVDAARTSKRFGFDVRVVCITDEENMPARRREIENAKLEGVSFMNQLKPVEIIGKEKVSAVRFVKTTPEGKSLNDSGEEQIEIRCNSVIVAIGQKPNNLVIDGAGIEVDEQNRIKVNEKLETSIKNVFSAGDCVLGAKTVIEAIDQAKNAANSIREYLS